ncbi:cupin domain-containing protein [Telmatospirillum siberiense]|uniref:Transcription negative regulator ChrR n=1 Tax=Telmatospirillum siberiense TaxID=382514 RepID=A0A2N3PVI3_9PROT|nr:cupin domain-containing protein [Telmatospirillum siberiense]PKU24400.1 transcription negative regulator ChrR [Telmatospirillum siberiense]
MSPQPIVLAQLFDNPAAWEGLDWTPFREGIEAAWLHRSEDGGPASALLRYRPGAAAPRHRHVGWEHIIILSGSQGDHRGTYGVGSLIANPPGSEHDVHSRDGCIALLIWEKTPQFL